MTRTGVLLVAALLAQPREVAAQSMTAATSRPSLAPGATVTDSLVLSLAEAVARVATRSTSLLAASSRRAARLPTITATAQFTWQPSAAAGVDGVGWNPDPTAPVDQRLQYLERATPAAGLASLPPQLRALSSRYAWTAGLSSQATLLDFGRIRSAVAAARARRHAADAVVAAEQARARLDAEVAYRQLLLARARVTVAESARATMADDLAAVRDRRSRGVASELDVLRAEMQLADFDRRVADAVAAERGVDVQLRVLADLPGEPVLTLASPVAADVREALEEMELSDLLDAVHAAHRRSAEASVSAAEADLGATRASGRPSLVLRGDLQAIKAPADAFDLGGDWADVRTLTAVLQVPLFNPGQRAEVRAARARLAQASVDARRVADGARGDRSSAVAERARAHAAWRAARGQLGAATRVAELTDAAAAQGITTSVDQARARLDVLEARSQVLEAVIDYLSAEAIAGNGSKSQP